MKGTNLFGHPIDKPYMSEGFVPPPDLVYIVVIEDREIGCRMATFEGPQAQFAAEQFAKATASTRTCVCTLAQRLGVIGDYTNIGKVANEISIDPNPNSPVAHTQKFITVKGKKLLPAPKKK